MDRPQPGRALGRSQSLLPEDIGPEQSGETLIQDSGKSGNPDSQPPRIQKRCTGLGGKQAVGGQRMRTESRPDLLGPVTTPSQPSSLSYSSRSRLLPLTG
jgi:hypothetical protein